MIFNSNLVYHRVVLIIAVIIGVYSLYTNLHILSWYIHKENMNTYGISEITALNIGQGDSFLIETVKNDGKNVQEIKVLIDTGPQTQMWNDEYFRTGSIFSHHKLRKTIDLLMISHDDADHGANISRIMAQNRVGTIIVSPYLYTYIDKYKTKIDQKNIKILKMMRGMNISSGINKYDGFKIEVLYPLLQQYDFSAQTRSGNEHSLIARSIIASTTALFTGDAGYNEEEKLVSLGMEHIDILKVGHHGSNTSTSIRFLDRIRPYLAIISAEFKNSYGHPHAITLKNLEKFIINPKANILRTDQCGQQKIVIYKNGVLGRHFCKNYDKSIREKK